MPTYAFHLICAGPEASVKDRRNFQFGILCDDSQAGSVPGITRLDFQREAPNYTRAVRSALDELKRDAPELEVLRYTLAPAHHAEVERDIEEWFPGATAFRKKIEAQVLDSRKPTSQEPNP